MLKDFLKRKNDSGEQGTPLPEVTEVLRALLDVLPPNCATLSTKTEDGGLVAELIPTSQTAARIVARRVGNVGYDLIVGQGALYEIRSGWTRSADSKVVLQELQEICSAVLAGKFEETIWMVGNKPAKTLARIGSGSEAKTLRMIHGFYPFRVKTRRHIKYSAYFVSN